MWLSREVIWEQQQEGEREAQGSLHQYASSAVSVTRGGFRVWGFLQGARPLVIISRSVASCLLGWGQAATVGTSALLSDVWAGASGGGG